jgi:sugar lactone lactonase YvrE
MSTSAPIITEAQQIIRAQATLGEGAIWNPLDQKLYWVDILGCMLHIYDPETGHGRTFPTGDYVGTVVPETKETVLLALQTGIHRMDTNTGVLTLLNNPLPGAPVRFNDGKCDPSGRFWVGTLYMDGTRGSSKLYRFDPDRSIHEMLHEISISNGIVWSADKKTMYYTDTPTSCVEAFDFDDETGKISNPRIILRIPEEDGFPDGMTIDSEDNLWIGMWGGGSVNCYDPKAGTLLQQIKVPAPHTTSCAFGGPEFKTLFITTARAEMDEETLTKFPQSGDVFMAQPGASGVPAHCFAKR